MREQDKHKEVDGIQLWMNALGGKPSTNTRHGLDLKEASECSIGPISRRAAKVGYRTVDTFAVKSSCNPVKKAYVVVALLVAQVTCIQLPVPQEPDLHVGYLLTL